MKPLLYTGIIQALFVALFMVCKQPNRLSDKIIASWMVFMACPMLSRLGSMNYPDAFFSELYLIRSFSLTFGPFLWLYTHALIDKKQSFTKSDLWHFLPFCIFAFLQSGNSCFRSILRVPAFMLLHPLRFKRCMEWQRYFHY